MITQLRKSFTEKWIKVILWIPILTMGLGTVLYQIPTFFQGRNNASVAITVNNTDIGFEELQRQINRETGRIAMLRQQFGPNADMFLKMYGLDNPSTLATQALVSQTLLDSVAHHMNIQIDPKLIMQRLQDPSFLIQQYPDMLAFGVFGQDGSINPAALRVYASKTRQSIADIEEGIEQAVSRALVLDTVSATVYVSQQEIKNAFVQDFASKKFSVLSLPLDAYITAVKKEGISAQELEQFFKNKNQENKRYWVPEKRSGTYWVFSPEDYGVSVTDKQMQAYYEQHKHKKFVQTPAQVQIRRILFKVSDETKRQEITQRAEKVYQELQQNPKQFEALAKHYSDDKDTASKGGLMPLFARGEKDPVIERAAFRLANDGDISGVLSTSDGLQVVQRVSKKPIAFKSFESASGEIKKTLVDQQFKDAFSKELERMIRTLKENPETFKTFAQEKKGSKKELNSVERGFTPELEKLFKLKKNNWEFYFDGTKGVVITTTDVKKSYEPELNTVKARVEDDAIRQKATDRLQADLERIKREKLSLADAQKKFGGSIESIDWLKKDDEKKSDELSKRGVPVTRMLTLTTPGSMMVSSDASKGFVIKLDNVEPFNEQQFASKKNEIAGRLYAEKKQLNQRGFIASLMRNATIKTVENDYNAQLPVDDEML